MITDPYVEGLLHPPKAVEYAVMIFFVIFILGLSRLLIKRKRAKAARERADDALPTPAVKAERESDRL